MENESKEKKVAEEKKEAVKKVDKPVEKKKPAAKKETAKKSPAKKTAAKTAKTETVEKAKDKQEEQKVEEKKELVALKKTFEIEVPNAEIEKSIDEIATKYSTDIKLSGFRKGKVPAELLKSRYKGALNEEALNKIVEEYVFKKIEEDKMRIVSQPMIDKIDHEEGKDLKATVTVELYPEFELPELDTIEVEISQKDLELKPYDEKENIDMILKSRKRLVHVADREIKENDYVSFKFQTKILKTKKMTPRVEESAELIKDKTHYIKELHAELMGKKTGDKLSFQRSYPEDYNKARWAGETVEHFIEITRVQEYFTPDLSEELLKELGFKDEVSFKEKLKADYENYAAKQLDEVKNMKRIEALLSKIEFPVPESLIAQEIQRIQKDPQAAYRMKDENELKQKAIESVKYTLIHMELMKKYEIEAKSEDLEKEYKSMAEQYNMPAKEIRKYYSGKEQQDALKDKIRGEKVSELLKEKIKVKEIK